MQGYIALFIAFLTAIVAVYHYVNYPKEYLKCSKEYHIGFTKALNPAGAGIGIIFIAVFFLSAYFLYLNIAIGSAICILILFIDYKILKKISKF